MHPVRVPCPARPRRIPARPPRRAVAFLALAAAALAGCRSTPEPRVEPALYDGPPIRREADSRQHRVVLAAPSGGWGFTRDQVRKRFNAFDVYLTARRPDPTLNHIQAVVEQTAGTEVDPAVPIDVYVRVIDFKADPKDIPYRRVPLPLASSPPVPAPPQPAPQTTPPPPAERAP